MRRRYKILAVGLSTLVVVFFFLPTVRFQTPYSTVLEDKQGQLLSATIAKDGQWRFPASDSVPRKFVACLLQFEDRHFYEHWGFNPISFGRAAWINIRTGRIKQGGSTLTMQTVRLSRGNPRRSVWEKLYEIVLAFRTEVGHSKNEILNLYASHAPFGGNVVGLEAAAWRYFGRRPEQLSWGESALLAVLPNSPSLIYPGKNQDRLKSKRDRLLRRLLQQGTIDQETCELAELEPLPQAPKPLPKRASHLLQRMMTEGQEGKKIRSTLHAPTQQMASALLEHYHRKLESNSIHNGAVLIVEVETGKTIAYVGNTQGTDPQEGYQVDIASAPRSYGSLLKPILFAAAMDGGLLLPHLLLEDIPTNIAGYRPQNFLKEYEGAVPASDALARSLNVPFVRLLHEYSAEKLYDVLHKSGLRTLNRSPEHYGLSIILGGGESNLFELTGTYASIARSIVKVKNCFATPVLMEDSTLKLYKLQPSLSPASMYFALEALSESKRPGNEGEWIQFSSSQKIYWKTGTSFGSRDAWAIGVTRKYAVGVWLGNASGEGRPGLTGIGVAAPLLFDVFAELPQAAPLKIPNKGVSWVNVCKQSGYKASNVCPDKRECWVPAGALKSETCPYHALVHLDKSGAYRVNSSCEQVGNMQHRAWFVLPTIQEWYYKPKHPDYRPLPPWRADCAHSNFRNNLDIIYPRSGAKIYIPFEISNKMGKVVFEAAHRRSSATLFWHVDNEFVGETKNLHQLSLQLPPGPHTLTLVDEEGETRRLKFEILEKRE